MTAPQSFVEALERQSRGRLRIRWSEKRGAWHIEQRVGRASLPPSRIDPYDDSRIRAKDGTWFVMEIRPGDRMPCPTCKATLKVPVFEFGEAICMNCKAAGRHIHKFKASHFPLSDMLLEHLRKIDPENDGLRRLRNEVEAANASKEAIADRDVHNSVESITKDNLNQLFDVASSGYTGKVMSGTEFSNF